MKIHEYNQMMNYLTRPGKVLANNINDKKISNTERTGLAKGTKSDTKVMPKKEKILQYIDDFRIVYDGKEATKAETEAAVKRIDSYKNQMSKQDEYNTYFNKKSPKYYKNIAKKIPVIPPKPDLPNGHSDWTTDDWLHSIDSSLWMEDKKAEIHDDLMEKYLELLKAGELLPNTTFEMFEKNYHDFDTDVISKINKKVREKKRAEGLAALLSLSPDRI